jgi:hypothetical protein
MTLEQILLYPLRGHRVTEQYLKAYDFEIKLLSDSLVAALAGSHPALPAPAKAKRHYSRKAAAEKVQS